MSQVNKRVVSVDTKTANQIIPIQKLKLQYDRLIEEHQGMMKKAKKYKSKYEELKSINETLKSKIQALRSEVRILKNKYSSSKAARHEIEGLQKTVQSLTVGNQTLKADNQSLQIEIDNLKSNKNNNEELKLKMELLESTVQNLKNDNKTLLAENNLIKSDAERMKVETGKIKMEMFRLKAVYEKMSDENEKLRTENDKLRVENANIETETFSEKEIGEQPQENAVPLNSFWNSLSLGAEMYDSLFSFKVDTPQIGIDPVVWNIIYAAVPADYSIPDSKFVNILSTHVARELLKPVMSSTQSLELDSFLEGLK